MLNPLSYLSYERFSLSTCKDAWNRLPSIKLLTTYQIITLVGAGMVIYKIYKVMMDFRARLEKLEQGRLTAELEIHQTYKQTVEELQKKTNDLEKRCLALEKEQKAKTPSDTPQQPSSEMNNVLTQIQSLQARVAALEETLKNAELFYPCEETKDNSSSSTGPSSQSP